MHLVTLSVVIISVVSLGVGSFIYLKPRWTIDLQKNFYEKINWRIEPISLVKEIRNTKIMGLFLIIFVILLFWLAVGFQWY